MNRTEYEQRMEQLQNELELAMNDSDFEAMWSIQSDIANLESEGYEDYE